MGDRLPTLSRVYLAAFAVLVVMLAASGLATADKPATLLPDPPAVFFSADFSPEKLSKSRSEPTPIAFSFSFIRKIVDEQPPLPLKEFVLEGDKHAGVDLRGIPTCKLGVLPRTSIERLREICRPALVGHGHMEVAVKFPDQPLRTVESDVLAISGGVEGRVAKMYLLAYFSAPVTSLIFTTVKIKKIRRDRYGTEAVASIPKIAGDFGWVTRFRLTLKKRIVSATCTDGRLSARGTAVLADETRSEATAIRVCTPRD
jgi:hypothetical protein